MARCVAFDVDGVLIDTDAVHFDALNRALTDAVGPYAVITPHEHANTFKGLPTRLKLAALLEMGRLTPSQVSHVGELKRLFTRYGLRSVPYDPAKADLMRTLRKRGFRLGACSNAIRESVLTMLEVARVGWAFEFILSNEDAAPKPSPDMYLKAAARFGIAPDQLIVVEDGAPGLAAAAAARARVVRVEGPAEVTLALLPRIEEMAG